MGCLLLRSVDGEGDGDRGADAESAVEVQSAEVGGDDALTDGEAEARAASGARAAPSATALEPPLRRPSTGTLSRSLPLAFLPHNGGTYAPQEGQIY